MALTKNDFNQLKKIFATKIELEELKDEVKEILQKHRSELLNKMDKILKEILSSRQEQTVLSHQTSGHGDRISTLEEIHPQGQHTSI